ncbi:MAG: hypothetical protein M9905_17645 [Rhizobiaceae bacterium]|nr:hypothetical protein [Rhizobiaceae bacterium]
MKTFACSYPFAGRVYALHIDAQDEADCSRRLRAIGIGARVDGELIAEITLEGRDGWLTKLRRLFGSLSS